MAKEYFITLFLVIALTPVIAFQSIQIIPARKGHYRQLLFSDYLSSLASPADNNLADNSASDFPAGISNSAKFFPTEFANDDNSAAGATIASSAEYPTEFSYDDSSTVAADTSNMITSSAEYPTEYTTSEMITSSAEYPTEYTTIESAASLEAQQPLTQIPTATGSENTNALSFSHAPIPYFAIDKLTPKGPRKGADIGEPHDSSRKLEATAGSVSAGAWWCAKGGWPSPNERGTTEIFYVLEGNGCVTDVDGHRHYFGPGDTVILPKGWSGRWDVLEDIHKIWVIHDHPTIEGREGPIRANIMHYHMFTPQYLSPPRVRADAMHETSPSTAFRTFYDVGTTKVGCWTCSPGSFPVTSSAATTECFHVLEGVFFLTGADGNAKRCVAGDTVMLPPGWTGGYDVIETTKKLWVAVE